MLNTIDPKRLEFGRRLARIGFAEKQSLKKKTAVSSSLHVVYLLANTSICGGAKIILEHATYLSQAGIKVTLVSHDPPPTWFNFTAEYLCVSWDNDLAEGIPPCDVIVATYWDQIQSCIERHIAPIVYFEQGDYHLFDTANLSPPLASYIQTQFSLPPFIMTVCDNMAKLINTNYAREAIVIPNAVNNGIFNLSAPAYTAAHPYLLMMGSDTLAFKGTDEIFKAYESIKKQLPTLDLLWITPWPPSKTYPTSTSIFLHPTQSIIASLYRGAFAFISASHYESFSLPVLEAMSCGCPVITTATTGTTDYAKDHVNCLFFPIGDTQSLAHKIQELAYSPALRTQLIHAGLTTAEKYSWPFTIQRLITFYKEVATYQDAK